MPSYKTHSIHGELVLEKVDKMIEINNELMKIYSIGPDSLIATDYNTFNYQHGNKTRDYFLLFLKKIKENKLQDNEQIMAFLYGQIDHFILDCIMHPFIYYYTENLPKNHVINPHGLVEMNIDNYVILKHNKNDLFYYKNIRFSRELNLLINELYKEIYNTLNASINYNVGVSLIKLFDVLVRRRLFEFSPLLGILNIGDIAYHRNIDNILPFINIEKDIWYNPETGKESRLSFDELWNNSLEESLSVIKDVNNYLYHNKPITNYYLLNDISYDTGLPCKEGQKLKYLKKY